MVDKYIFLHPPTWLLHLTMCYIRQIPLRWLNKAVFLSINAIFDRLVTGKYQNCDRLRQYNLPPKQNQGVINDSISFFNSPQEVKNDMKTYIRSCKHNINKNIYICAAFSWGKAAFLFSTQYAKLVYNLPNSVFAIRHSRFFIFVNLSDKPYKNRPRCRSPPLLSLFKK